MADKSVGELIAAQSVTPTDLFVLEQNGTAKKLTGQVLENWLVSFADGHGGIQSIVKKGTSGLVDTYRITLADTTTFDFMVTNGKSIKSISKASTSGLVDTYRIAFNDGTSSTFTVTNGEKGDKGDNQYVWIKYASQKPTATSHSFGDVADDWIGIYSGSSDTAPTDWTQYEWFKIKGEKGYTGEPATLVSSSVTYQVGDSGTIIPSGSWSESIPTVSQGKYLWTREITKFNTGNPITKYSVSRFGIDGTGAVSTVAGVSPDAIGNVPLTAADVGALPNIGGTMKGSINMNGQRITGLNTPTQSNEVATKGYVDNAKPNMTGYATETYVNNAVGAKVDKEKVVNNFTTTAAGYVADARALKTLNDSKLSMELLWENARPTSAFAAQTLSIPALAGYTIVYILFRNSSGYKTMNGIVVNLESGYDTLLSYNSNGRQIFRDGTTLTFSHVSSDNRYCVPDKIYGIKGVS